MHRPGPILPTYVMLLLGVALSGVAVPQSLAIRFDRCLDSCRTAMSDGDHEAAMAHVGNALDLAIAEQDSLLQATAYLHRGEVFQRRSDLNKALADFYEAQLLFEAMRDEQGMAEAYNNIGSIHHYDKNHQRAEEYYTLSLGIRERLGPDTKKALLYNNFGALLEDMGQPEPALAWFRKALPIRIAQQDSTWLAVTWANMGKCFDELGMHDSALFHLHNSIAVPAAAGNRYLMGTVSVRIGFANLNAGRPHEALPWCRKGLDVAVSQELPLLVMESCECLHRVYMDLGRTGDALAMLQRYTTMRDSLFGSERAKELTRMELTHHFDRRQLADSLARMEERALAERIYVRERDQKRLFLFWSIAVLVVSGGLWSRLRYMRRSRNEIARERERSERLLLNILPKAIAEELKDKGVAEAKEVPGVSILFTDIENFTELVECMDARQLVATLDTCFKAFDRIAKEHGLEKIKTIGDAYMCAGGLPLPSEGSALATVRAALAMQRFMHRSMGERKAQGLPTFRMRAGIHTGPVVAGIVGDTKFQYDVWGDTVNIAARMESSGTSGLVNISTSTQRLVQDTPGLRFAPRGMISVKGMGSLEMYFVTEEAAPIAEPQVNVA